MNASFATVLFAAIVAALIAMPMAAPAPTKVTTTVLAKADRLPVPPAQPSCAQENWPNFSASCLRYTDDRLRTEGYAALAGGSASTE
jgi:hypothetical protein